MIAGDRDLDGVFGCGDCGGDGGGVCRASMWSSRALVSTGTSLNA